MPSLPLENLLHGMMGHLCHQQNSVKTREQINALKKYMAPPHLNSRNSTCVRFSDKCSHLSTKLFKILFTKNMLTTPKQPDTGVANNII